MQIDEQSFLVSPELSVLKLIQNNWFSFLQLVSECPLHSLPLFYKVHPSILTLNSLQKDCYLEKDFTYCFTTERNYFMKIF